MDDEKIKGQIGANIAERRKAAGMTQAGLAEKINYSVKLKSGRNDHRSNPAEPQSAS